MKQVRIIATSPLFSIDKTVPEKKCVSELNRIKKLWTGIVKKVEKPLMVPSEVDPAFFRKEGFFSNRARVEEWHRNNKLTVATQVL